MAVFDGAPTGDCCDNPVLAELYVSGRGCVVESPEGVCGGDKKATFFCVSVFVAVVFTEPLDDLRALDLIAGSNGSAGLETGEDTGRPTPLSLSASWGSSIGGRGRLDTSGRGFVDAIEDGVPVLVPVVPALAERWIWLGVMLGEEDERRSCLLSGRLWVTCEGGHSGRRGNWASSFLRVSGVVLGDGEFVDELRVVVSLRSGTRRESLSLSLSLLFTFSLSFSLSLSLSFE